MSNQAQTVFRNAVKASVKPIDQPVLKEQTEEKKPDFYDNLTHQVYTEVLDGGGIAEDTILPIVGIVKTTVKVRSEAHYEQVFHGLGQPFDFFGRYKDPTNFARIDTNPGDWITIQDVFANSIGVGGVEVYRITNDFVELYFSWDVGVYPDVPIELYFIKRSM